MNKLIIASIMLSLAALAHAQVIITDNCVQCIQQDPFDGTNCINPGANANGTTCHGANGNQCFARVNERGFVERNCFVALDQSLREICNDQSDSCRTCTGPACNNQIFPPKRLHCHICTGAANSNCSGTITGNPVVCPVFTVDDRCFIARPEGPEGAERNFERGCLSSIAQDRCGENEACFTCEGNGCNHPDYNGAFSISTGTSFFVMLSTAILIMLK